MKVITDGVKITCGCGSTEFSIDAMVVIDYATNKVLRVEEGQNIPPMCNKCNKEWGEAGGYSSVDPVI